MFDRVLAVRTGNHLGRLSNTVPGVIILLDSS